MEIDINTLPEEKIMDLATECLDSLSLKDRIRAVLKCFSDEERVELATWLVPEDAEDEA